MFFLLLNRKNNEPFYKETQNDDNDLSEVDPSADLYGK